MTPTCGCMRKALPLSAESVGAALERVAGAEELDQGPRFIHGNSATSRMYRASKSCIHHNSPVGLSGVPCIWTCIYVYLREAGYTYVYRGDAGMTHRNNCALYESEQYKKSESFCRPFVSSLSIIVRQKINELIVQPPGWAYCTEKYDARARACPLFAKRNLQNFIEETFDTACGRLRNEK